MKTPNTPLYKAGALALSTGLGMARRYVSRRKPAVRRRVRRRTKLITKRKRTLTRTRTRKKYKLDAAAAHSELTKTALRGGYKMRRTLRNLWKIESRKTHKSVFGYSNISNFGGDRGADFLSLTQNAAGAPVTAGCIRLWSITAAPNVDTNGNIINPSCHFFPTFSNEADTGVLSWNFADTTFPINTSSAVNQTSDFPNDKSILNYMSAKFMLYNAINSPGKYMFEIVSFKDDRLLPGAALTTPLDQRFATSFWQSISKPYIFNPVAATSPEMNKYMKVHKRLFILMDSKDTTETVNTKYKEVNIFHRFNKPCRYDWAQADRMNIYGDDAPTNIGDNQTDVKPSQRVYLLLRALISRPTTYPVVYSTERMPSYDVQFRTCHTTDR